MRMRDSILVAERCRPRRADSWAAKMLPTAGPCRAVIALPVLAGLGGGFVEGLAEANDLVGDLFRLDGPVGDADALGVDDEGRADGHAG